MPMTTERSTWREPNRSLGWVLGTFRAIAGPATAGETALLGRVIAAEADRMDVAGAAAPLATVGDHQTIFDQFSRNRRGVRARATSLTTSPAATRPSA